MPFLPWPRVSNYNQLETHSVCYGLSPSKLHDQATKTSSSLHSDPNFRDNLISILLIFSRIFVVLGFQNDQTVVICFIFS